MKKTLAGVGSTLAFLAAAPGAALAHPGADHVHGFAEGVGHPITGVDHVLAMVAVGLLAAQLSGRALWATPLTFMAMMVVGGALGMAQVELPMVEIAIALSVAVLGVVLLLGVGLPTLAAMGLAGFFAIFHGYAHGAEMPETAAGFAYGAGFVVATGLLHAAGIGLGLAARRASVSLRPRLFRAAGGAFALAGAVLLVGAL
jgi:urease accessory protein